MNGAARAGLLTVDMKRVVEQQHLGFVATVCADGTPNLSPKGTTAVWDEEHLVFANIRSPGTLANLRRNASVEVNVVDPFLRKGYRFKGVASILESGTLYDKVIAFYAARGSRVSAIREVVMVRVEAAHPIDSPAYDAGLTEDEVRSRWERYFESLRGGRTAAIQQAVPLLRVADVARSIEWYQGTLGYAGDPFPETPPYQFAILRRGRPELMLRRGSPPIRSQPRPYDWDVYLRLEGRSLRDLFATLSARGVVTRRLERMFYGQAEFEITDPDGHVICLSEALDDASDLPTPVV